MPTRVESSEKLAHAAEFLVALGEEFRDRKGGSLRQSAGEDGVEKASGGNVVHMSAAFGFGNDGIDQLEAQQILRGDFQRFGSGLGLGGVAPHDGGAALGRNDRVNRIFEHENAIANRDGERAA